MIFAIFLTLLSCNFRLRQKKFDENAVFSLLQECFFSVSVAKNQFNFLGKISIFGLSSKIEEYRYLILSWFRSSILTYYVYRFSRPTSTRYSECDINKYIYIYIKIYIDIFCWHSSFRNNIDIDITDTFEPEKEK